MSTTNLKEIISEINSLLGKNYNLLSFDLKSPMQLLQDLSDVLTIINGCDVIDLREENLEDTVMRLMEVLRILNYRPDTPPIQFRQGLVQGEKKIVYPILEWAISNLDDLKKRAYLAQYLVKVEIPAEFLSDPDISYLYEEYEKVIEIFKEAHKENEALKDSAQSLSELRADITAMDQEKDSVQKKIEKLMKKVEMHPEKEGLLESAKLLRIEKEKTKDLIKFEEKQQEIAATNEQKLQRLTSQLRESKHNFSRTTPEELLRRLEEEVSVNSYLVREKLPKEQKIREDEIEMLEMVGNQHNLSRAHLDDLNFKIQQVSAEIAHIMETQFADQSSEEDKNATFRQQATIIGRKKEAKAEQLGELRNQMAQLTEDLAVRQKQLTEIAGDVVLRGEDLKKYVGKLRGRGALYKKQKAQLAALKTEAGILTRTLEILAVEHQSIMQNLTAEEATHGVEGYRETQSTLEFASEEKSTVDASKERTLAEMSKLVTELNQRIAAKKSQLEPIIEELRPLREEFREVQEKHDQLKKEYDATSAGLENETSRLQQEVEKMEKDRKEIMDEIEKLDRENQKAELDLVRVAQEVKLYVSGSTEAKKNSLREQLQKKVADQEKIGKQLKEEQVAMKDRLAKCSDQVRYWKDLERLMQCKIECLNEERKKSGVLRRERGAETLILPQ